MKFVDDYCQGYQPLLPEVRIFEAFKNLPIGRLPDIKRKLLPAIAIFGGARSGTIITPFSHSIPLAGRAVERATIKANLTSSRGVRDYLNN